MARPLVIAHRGASGYEPENSLAAFRAAIARGADGVELDIHNTVDGELLVHHDEQLRDGRHISRVTTAELLSHHLSNSEPIPTLTQVLSVLGPTMLAFVELKTLAPQFDARLLETLAAGPNPAGYAIHSFDHRIVRRVGAAQGSLRRGVLSASYAIRPTIAMEDAGAKDLWQEQSLVDSALVAAVHRAGGRVLAWTATTAERMRELIQLGVDGICTNYPDVARRAVDQLAA